MTTRCRPTHGLTVGERVVFWRLLAAVGDTHSADVDVEEHCRNVARSVVWHRANPPQKRSA